MNMKTATKLAAQGDVIFRRVEALPCGYEETEDRIVAHSETGHHHTVHGDLQRYTSQTDAMLSYIVAKGPVEVRHHRDYDTHETLKLKGKPKGETIWEVRRQREYTPEGWRRVED